VGGSFVYAIFTPRCGGEAEKLYCVVNGHYYATITLFLYLNALVLLSLF